MRGRDVKFPKGASPLLIPWLNNLKIAPVEEW
jgi:hypothetical protein